MALALSRTTNIIKEEYPAPIRSKNGSFARWYDGFLPGTIFGVIFLFFLFATVSVEVARIFTGSLNRATGSNNYYQLYPNNIYSLPSTTFNVGISSFATNANFERQHHYLWPWSHPSLFFAIPVSPHDIPTTVLRSTVSEFFCSALVCGYFWILVRTQRNLLDGKHRALTLLRHQLFSMLVLLLRSTCSSCSA